MYLFLSIFVVIGSGCLLYAPVKLVKTVLFISRAASTNGIVTDLHASRGSKSTSYAPVVSFSVPGGRSIEFRSQISSGSSDYSIGEQVPVYYDPRRPESAEIRAFVPLWMPTIILSALGLAFTAVGGWVMFAMRRGVREAQQKAAALQQGVKDWETDPAWRSGAIRSSTRQEMWFYWLFAVVWNVIAQPTGFIAVYEFFDKGNRLAAIGLMFPLVGFWLLSVAIRKTLQVRKFGEIVLQMNPLPGSLGGEVGGVVELPVPFRAGQAFSVSLSCQKSTRHNNGTTQELVWQDTGRAVAAPAAGGTRIAFRFAVPAQLPPSGDAPVGSHQWVVRVTADLPGIDLDRSFQIPVVASASPQASTLDVPLAPSLEPVTQLSATIVRIAQQAGGLSLRYPPRRNLKSGLVIAFMGAWFLFFTCIFIVKGVAGLGIVMLPVFGLIGLALLLTAVWMFGYSLEVDAAVGELVVVRRFLGVPVKRVLIPASALQAVEAIRFGVLDSGSTATLIFKVVARCADGTRITIGDGIEGRANAESIARMIAQKYGLGGAK